MAFFMALQQRASAASVGSSFIVCCFFHITDSQDPSSRYPPRGRQETWALRGTDLMKCRRNALHAVKMQIKQKTEKPNNWKTVLGELNQSILWWSTFIR